MLRTLLCLGLSLQLSAVAAHAQSWPTTEWSVLSIDEAALTGNRAMGAEFYRQQLEDASRWYESLGFLAPAMIREGEEEGGPLGRYIGHMNTKMTLGASYRGERGVYSDDWGEWVFEQWVDFLNPGRRMVLGGDPATWNPTSRWETTMSYGPAHELFHAVQASYGRPQGVPHPSMCSSVGGQDVGAEDWLWEGMASAVQIRYMERVRGIRFEHPYTSNARAAWVRYFDHPLHEPRHSKPPKTENLSWYCGYGSWYFWYAAGEMLDPGEKIRYLQYILKRTDSWADLGLARLDGGLREAAKALGAPSRYDGGLYEVYPTFIAEYVDDTRFYHEPVSVPLRGRSEVAWRIGNLDPVATTAFEVTIDVDDTMPPDESARVRVTLDPQPNRDQLHLIEGQRQAVRPLGDEDPYSLELAVRKDTTILVRLANVAEEASATLRTEYRIRFELGGFYGTPASGPYIVMSGDIPPGFTVLSGPPAIMGCNGTLDGGSVFDLVTADEAVGDIRRAFDRGELMLQDMEEAIEAEEIPIPNATPQQREAFRRAMARNDEQAEQMREAMSQAQAQIAQARQENEDRRNTRGVEVTNKTAERFAGRSRLTATFVGESGGKPCQVMLTAVLEGEDGGAQVLGVRDSDEYESEGPFPIGIETVNYIVGSIQESPLVDDPFRICMMTPRERAEAAQTSCPVLCTPGELRLERAEQGHIQGTFRADMLASTGQTAQGCPVMDRIELVFGFNITSANSGQDAEVMRSMSDEMLRQIGLSAEEIDALRQFDSGDIR